MSEWNRIHRRMSYFLCSASVCVCVLLRLPAMYQRSMHFDANRQLRYAIDDDLLVLAAQVPLISANATIFKEKFVLFVI